MSTFELVKAAVGDPSLPTTISRKASPHFDFYDIDLPLPEFGGIPRSWLFLVLNGERARSTSVSRERVLEEVHQILGDISRLKLVVILTDDPRMHIADEFGNLQRDVFCLDHAELPHTKSYETEPRLAPFILAIRRRLSIQPVLARAFSPYQRNLPASSWRFFGREKQLTTIIDGNENLVVVGARRIGKTSLLHEAERRLKEDGRTVYYIDVQHCHTANDVVSEILRTVSPREAARAIKHHEIFQESVFSNLLRMLASGGEPTILLLDELGNVLAGRPKEDWEFIGLLRKYGTRGGLRFVISCFQELFFRQQKEFEGPLINFANTMRLDAFTRREVENFVIAPLNFWKPLGSTKQELLDLVLSNVGSHPFFLQFFCQALFERFTEDRNFNPIQQANVLLRGDIDQWFSTAVDELFFRIPSQALQYLFLRRCYDADLAGQKITQAEFTDDWIEKALNDLGYLSTLRGRRNLLDGLEMHGLCSAVDYDRAKKVVAAPLVFSYVRQSQSLSSFDAWLKKLGKEIDREHAAWELTKSLISAAI